MYPAPRTPHPTRRGFTLVEILVTITILGMMASMLLLAVQAANNSAKVAKTKATIAKINHFVMLRYDSYRTRRLAINVINYVASNSAWYPSPSISNPAETLTHQLARARVNAIRDLMRMEMPDRWTDIQPQGKLNQVPLIYDPSVTTPVAAPSITQRYLNAYNSAPTTPDLTFQSAQLLYMIVMSDSEAPHQFATNEIGTVDGSGLRVFLDGWGNPIFFLRWPAGGGLVGAHANHQHWCLAIAPRHDHALPSGDTSALLWWAHHIHGESVANQLDQPSDDCHYLEHGSQRHRRSFRCHHPAGSCE